MAKISNKKLAKNIKKVFDNGIELTKVVGGNPFFGHSYQQKTVSTYKELAVALKDGWYWHTQDDADFFYRSITIALINAYED